MINSKETKKMKSILTEAGNLAISMQSQMKIKTKEDSSIVTDGDIAVSDFLNQKLLELYPEYEIFSEENSTILPKGSKVIVIDPIDGTESYSRKEDTWAILVGFLENNTIIKGFVYQPTLKNFYYAYKGKGAFLINQKNEEITLKVRESGELVSYSSPNKSDELNFLTTLGINKNLTLYSASIKIMEMAKGNCDIYPNFRKKCSLWDLVAPEIILTEAGGKIIYEEEDTIPINFKNAHINMNIICVGKRFIDFKTTKSFNEEK